MKPIVTATAAFIAATLSSNALAAETQIKKEKLQIVFLMGQSNMVGMAEIGTSWYLTQPQYVPPREEVMKKSEAFDWTNLYWQGVRYYQGPPEMQKALDGLLDDREASRSKWRDRTRSEWQAEWGEKPSLKGRDAMYGFLDKKAGEEGIYTRIAKILDGSENKFPMDKAYEEISHRDEYNAGHLKRVRDIYLNGTNEKDFEPFLKELEAVKKRKKSPEKPDDIRVRIAKLGQETAKLPIAKRTRIFSYGAFESSSGSELEATASGPLSIGWGAKVTTIGPEYAVGITLERLVDAPILLVKCAWGNTALREAWRPASLDGVETPIEKAVREEWNVTEAANAKSEGREPKPRGAREKTGKLSWCWNMALPAVKKVLENPGLYHPEYDPAKGYDIAGFVWLQGYSDMGNPAYGEELVEMIKWFRKEINAPKMPFVAGSMGVGAYYHTALTGNVSGGMVYASQSPELKGTVDVVNTGRYYPLELDCADNLYETYQKDSPQYNTLQSFVQKTTSNKSFHYRGSAKFHLLAGDAMARSLANMMAGGKPLIEDEIKAGK